MPPGACLSVVSVVCCQVERSLRRADHAFRGVLPTVMRSCVRSRSFKNEEAMARVGPQRHRQIYINIYRVSQEEYARFRESVPCVKLHRYNPKHPFPKLNGYGDNGQRSLKL